MNNRALGSTHKFNLKQTWNILREREKYPGLGILDPNITEVHNKRGEGGTLNSMSGVSSKEAEGPKVEPPT